ncbi:MAG TPA: HAMP domain-containing sensor histidine kinase [Puia sp.]
MKLFVKYSRVNIIASIGALLLGSIGYYFIVRYVLVHQLDDTLKIEEAEILDYVKTRDRLPEPANYRDQQIRFIPAETPVARQFVHTKGRGKGARHPDPDEPYRELLFSVRAGGQLYVVSVSKSEEETEDLLQLMMLITAGMILLLLGTLFLANRLLLRRIWQPFYQSLEGIRRFNLSSREPLPVTGTDIDEFRSLDEAARLMTLQILKDYEILKNFADNASHEMQTPLAIINSKLDLMIQDPGMEERHHRPIQSIYDAISRLRQLNQSLLLLTKIGNNQFVHTEQMDLAALIEEKLVQLEDMARDRHLVVRTDLDKLSLPVNGYLADILLNNLLLNAIRHNREGGHLDVRLRDGSLRISNSGAELSFDPATIFDRFTKGPHSAGTGLGLAIVRQICDNYRWPLVYAYEDGMHVMEIRFPLQNFDKIHH